MNSNIVSAINVGFTIQKAVEAQFIARLSFNRM
jgi:hypothetical protein